VFQRARRELQVGQNLRSGNGQEYTIERNISRTLSSQVLGAVRNQDRVEVAIKAPIIQVDEDAKRFERELQILYQVVGRPGIIRILDHGKNNEFAVLEYIGEITLSRLIKALSYNQIALKPKEVISILKLQREHQAKI
jgi:serine/threonine protein kinase